MYVCVGVRLEGGRGNGGDPRESAAGPQVRRCLFKRMSLYAPTSARHSYEAFFFFFCGACSNYAQTRKYIDYGVYGKMAAKKVEKD